MGSSRHDHQTHCDVGCIEVRHQTERAWLLTFLDGPDQDPLWIPRSVCEDPDERLHTGETRDEFWIEVWWAEKHNLI